MATDWHVRGLLSLWGRIDNLFLWKKNHWFAIFMLIFSRCIILDAIFVNELQIQG